MHKLFRKKLLTIVLILTFVVTFFSVQQTLAYDPTKTWPSQATGCKPVSGNIGATLNYVYLGTGTIPQSIVNQYPKASNSYLTYWLGALVGMVQGQFKSFILPAVSGYTSGPYAGQDLYYEVTIKAILTGPQITTTSSLIDVTYSLYTGCQVASTSPSSTSTNSVASVSASSTTTPPPPNYTGIIIGGGLVAVIIFSAVGYFIYNGRTSNLSTDKIIDKTRTRETKNIKSLKDSLDTKSIPKSNTPAKKASKSRRRR